MAASDHLSRLQGRADLRPSERYPKLDMENPRVFVRTVRNIGNVYGATPEQARSAGREWYPRVHEAVAKGVRGTSLSHLQGAGLVAAVSPSMDWDRNNINAFGELKKLKSGDWDAIHRSAQGKRRSGEATSVLRGMSISTAPDSALVKAHRILQGEAVDDVLPRRTGPKVNSFAHNIHEPDRPGPVTIDGRAHDIGANRMTPWNFTGRGINSASLQSGRPTRYEHFENAYRRAASLVGEDLPHNMQAITWLGGKLLERSGTTKSGQPKKQGPTRLGQKYL